MRPEDPEGIRIILVEVPAGHPSVMTCDRRYRRTNHMPHSCAFHKSAAAQRGRQWILTWPHEFHVLRSPVIERQVTARPNKKVKASRQHSHRHVGEALWPRRPRTSRPCPWVAASNLAAGCLLPRCSSGSMVSPDERAAAASLPLSWRQGAWSCQVWFRPSA